MRLVIVILLLLSAAGVRAAQPFLVELLDQERGNWKFLNVLGQKIEHPGKVAVAADMTPERAKVAILRLDDPEFPGDADRARFLEFPAVGPGLFELRTGGFEAKLSWEADGSGTLSAIRLGCAPEFEGIPTALCLSDGATQTPVRLTGHNKGLKLQSCRFGNVFTDTESVQLSVIREETTPVTAEYSVTDYFRNREITRGSIRLTGQESAFTLPLNRYGNFSVEIKLPGNSTSHRIVRIPEPERIPPERSFMGMNVFQQQIWYYSYQLPLFARAGIRWVRPWLHWENTWKMQQPREGVFDTKHLDAFRRRLARHDQKLVYILYNFSPTLGLPSTERSALDDGQMKFWRDYVKRIVGHCPEIDDWEVWNEPDLLASPQIPSFTADFYRKFLLETAAAIREAKPGAVVHSISHAGQLEWLKELCATGEAAKATDVVTLHSYARIPVFAANEEMRQQILDLGGFCGIPQQFNEIGASAYDGCPEYSKAFPGTTERIQAETLPVNWAQALHFAGPRGKAFWFPSLDPRDSTDSAQRTGDSGYGLFYLGGSPKTAFAALAATAKLLDGNECLGRMEIAGTPVRYVAFSGGRAIVWSDRRSGEIAATRLGCRPDEELIVYDLFANPVKRGKAAGLKIRLDDGPRFLVGSTRLGEIAQTARADWIKRRAATADAEIRVGAPSLPELRAGERRSFQFTVPEGSKVNWKISTDFPGTLHVRHEGKTVTGEVAAGDRDGTGLVQFTVQIPSKDAPPVSRLLPLFVDRTSAFTDGSFDGMSLREFQPTPRVRLDPNEGAAAPGCLRFDLPVDGRLHKWSDPLRPGMDLHFSATVKGRLSPDARVSFNIALFSPESWFGTWMPVSLRDHAAESGKFRLHTRNLKELPGAWTRLEEKLPGNLLPPRGGKLIFFIDCHGGREGDFLLIDDLSLYQVKAAN